MNVVKYVNESYEILTPSQVFEDALFWIEQAGRTAYQSSHKIGNLCGTCGEKLVLGNGTPVVWEYWCPKCKKWGSTGAIPSSFKFAELILKRGHESVLEHVNITVRFITCRGMTHELVRHRLASYTQESTRFCNYSGDQFEKEIKIIDQRPHIKTARGLEAWLRVMGQIQDAYMEMIDAGEPPEVARGVLPNDLKTDIVMTANLREWRHVFKLRTAATAHFNIRGLMRDLCEDFKQRLPIIFNDIRW